MATRDYHVRMPPDRTVRAACEDVGCENWRYGWDTLLDERTGPGRDAAAWIRSGRSGRTWRELPGAADGGVSVFRFEPHQRCFEEHRTRPARFLVADGAASRQHVRLGDWIEDFGEHMGRLEDAAKRG
jgi:hypothetical protein